ncbi:MAG TPA: DMT family transporter [Patescibacteria group bacterium]|nr:DMT family transporter [Patescibacteria group bacterium]
MLASAVMFGLMAVAIRLASQSLHTFEVAFFRNFFGLIATLPLLYRHGPGLLRTEHLPRYLLRCLVGVVGMLCGFWAIGHLPLAQAVALSYSSPIFVVIAAAMFLGERVHARRWTAVAIGFLGVLVITRPGSTDFSFGMVIAVCSAFMTGLVSVQIKQLSALEPADRIVFFTTLIWVPMSLLPALLVWRWPEGIVWLWVIAAGFLGTGGHMLWTRALKLGDVSALTPISFTQLPVVAIAGWLLFGEHVDRWTLLGTTIILGSSAYIAHREAQLARRHATREPLKSTEPST